jgi:DNA/RNA endonuclease G (NUC1)
MHRLPFWAAYKLTAADAYLVLHIVSIRELENLTGLDLLPKLDEKSLKQAVASELWLRN